jgi:hypothetical protein
MSKLADLKQQIIDNRKSFSQFIDQLKADRDLSPEGKRRRAAEMHQTVMEKHNTLVSQLQAAKRENVEDTKRRAFYPGMLSTGERTTFTRVLLEAQETEASKLPKVFKAAQFSNDTVTMAAVAAVAAQRGNQEVLSAYLESYPERRAAVDDYLNAAATVQDSRQMLMDNIQYVTPPSIPSDIG